jgi:hypothetical protein
MSQGKGDNSFCHLCSHQTLLSKSLDVVQEEILYVESHNVRETRTEINRDELPPMDRNWEVQAGSPDKIFDKKYLYA